MRHCCVVPAAGPCCPTLFKPSSVLLQVVASSLGDSRGAQLRHLVSRWASHWVCWVLDHPICDKSWCGLPGEESDVLWRVAAHGPKLAVHIAQLLAWPCQQLKGSHMRSRRHLNGRHLLRPEPSRM